MIAKNLTQLIGNTPLLELNKFSAVNNITTPIVAKVEYFNPGGSVKDRIALAMIEDAEQKGLLKPGATIIEPTSGNTGVGLALVAAVKGYKLILTMPETMSVERRNLVKAYGAEVRLTPGKDGMPGAIRAAEALRDSIAGSIILQQFENAANPSKHYATTGPEIWKQTDGNVDIFVAGVGTGGTVSGVGKYLKEQNIKILKRNFRVRSGEIDIVAFDGKYYCFIEVKYRKNIKYGGPEAAVTLSKQKQICNVSRFYLAFNQISESVPIRYDVIAISGEEGASTIKWYKDAFQYML